MKNYKSPNLEVVMLNINDVILESSPELGTSDEAFGFDVTEKV